MRPDVGMKTLALALMCLACPVRSDDWAESARPMYRGIEAVADGVYGLVRGHLISSLIPDRLSNRLSAVPVETSDRIFAERLRHRQEKATRRLLEERPLGPISSAEAATWERRAVRTHATVVTDSVVDALVSRYQLDRFGRDSGAYAANFSNWDPEFIFSAGLISGAYLYVAGLRTDFNIGAVRVDFDTRPGSAMPGAIQSGDASGLAALTLSRLGSPLSLKTEWGIKHGHMASERVAMNYSARF